MKLFKYFFVMAFLASVGGVAAFAQTGEVAAGTALPCPAVDGTTGAAPDVAAPTEAAPSPSAGSTEVTAPAAH